MIPRIKSYQPLKDFQLLVSFDDGREVRYDVSEDIATIPAFKDLATERGLFENAQMDASRTCIYWNDQIDLPSDAIYEYGASVSPRYSCAHGAYEGYSAHDASHNCGCNYHHNE